MENLPNSKPKTDRSAGEGFDELNARTAVLRVRVDRALKGKLPSVADGISQLHEAMQYSVLGGGKRVRPALVYAAGETLGLKAAALDIPACAVELVHVHSLVHDDLPAMDDDDLRRGKPACHKAFDEATAILVGNSLQALAFELLAGDPDLNLPPAQRLRMIATLAVAIGADGMASGQAIDLAATGHKLSVEQIETMHQRKTGYLIRASVTLAALCNPEVSADEIHALDHYAENIGLVFQITDDILDIEGDARLLGKHTGSDQSMGKPTYPLIAGMSAARQRCQNLTEMAVASLEPFGSHADMLRQMAWFILNRHQ
jgi:farnesyl diphosphate synthase